MPRIRRSRTNPTFFGDIPKQEEDDEDGNDKRSEGKSDRKKGKGFPKSFKMVPEDEESVLD